ncbi:hypothetical protein [Salibacter halophilus]|uniref:STAS/SEC14 domain-containing protein n=1 Tax=Salibacter halophilus TaxID=1803916 RepID=A0A6N6M8L7_9FLAO|nr:hypothetical protein [Salibacter halophilus]KAB1064434.1 hypothetical protein F3059_06970 [Salibacter halophilus]
MPAKFEIFPKDEFILEVFDGKVFFNDIIEVTQKIWSHPDYDAEFDGISDLSKADVKLSRDEMNQFIKAIEESQKRVSGKLAIIASKPLATAFAILFEKKVKFNPGVKVFTTHDGAIHYLGKDSSFLKRIYNEFESK